MNLEQFTKDETEEIPVSKVINTSDSESFICGNCNWFYDNECHLLLNKEVRLHSTACSDFSNIPYIK